MLSKQTKTKKMEYLKRLQRLHSGAEQLLGQVVSLQLEIRFFEEKQKDYVEQNGRFNPGIAFNLMEARRRNDKLLNSYKKTIKQINVEL